MKKAQSAEKATVNEVVRTAKQKNYEAKLAKVLAEQAKADFDKKAKQAEKASRAGKPGIIATIYNTIVTAKKPIGKSEILDVLLAEFKSESHTKESMMKTINAQLGNTRPNRMEREREVVFDVTTNKEGLNLYSYSE